MLKKIGQWWRRFCGVIITVHMKKWEKIMWIWSTKEAEQLGILDLRLQNKTWPPHFVDDTTLNSISLGTWLQKQGL